MIEGIKAALDFAHDPSRFRIVSFLTDGYIGNEAEILGEIHDRLGASRIFSFGIGSSTNRHLLERMALLGRGAVAFVGINEGAARAVDAFYERIAHPALTDISVDWGTFGVTDVYPQRIPDLFVGRPVVLTGRFDGKGPATIRVNGRAGGKSHEITLRVDPRDPVHAHPALANVWARMKIADLEDAETYAKALELGGQIKTVALEYGLMSAYTAFVAVDSTARTSGDHGVTVVQPVPVPDGVRYDTTVMEHPH
jgi:Ca-activated chloride channel family protein